MCKKVCFLFGAGAEANNNFYLPTGAQFMAASFLDDTLLRTLFANLKKSKFGGTYFNDSYVYSRHNYNDPNTFRSILKKWVFSECQSKDVYERYKKDIRAILSKEEFHELLTVVDSNTFDASDGKNKSDTEYSNVKPSEICMIDNGFKKIIAQLKIEASDRDLDPMQGQILEIFLEDNKIKSHLPTGIAHILDGHFHTIIDPYKHSRINFSKVFNYYWSIFYSVYRPVLELMNPSTKDQPFDYNGSLMRLEDDLKALYGHWDNFDEVKAGTYYQCIIQELDCFISGIITTNYFNFAERIIGVKTAYLNGQLKLFEIPETLEVRDITKECLPNDKLYFPFIFGQSYTKPIVSHYQIDAFNKMKDILDESNILVILGYNINEDDNHINAYLRDFVYKNNTNGKKRIIVVTNKENDPAYSKLKLDDEKYIRKCIVDYSMSPLLIIQKVKKKIESIDLDNEEPHKSYRQKNSSRQKYNSGISLSYVDC